MKNPITLSQSIAGWQLDARARRLSHNTMLDYQGTFRKFQDHLAGDPPIETITTTQVKEFLSDQTVSNKTLLNYHIGLSALWTWAVRSEIVDRHIIRQIRRPKPEQRQIEPFSEKDIRAMLGSLRISRAYARPGKRESTHLLPHPERHRAILLLLLDTGIRAGELCGMNIYSVDLKNNHISVFGKGAKQRQIPLSGSTGQAVWRYLTQRQNSDIGEPLFTTDKGQRLSVYRLGDIVTNIAARAAVTGANCHRFRHTFAINFLRNGGDVYSLQRILGHATLQMCKRYLALAQVDIDKAHRQASPVSNWGL